MWITATTARFFSNNGYIFQTTGTTWNNGNNFFVFWASAFFLSNNGNNFFNKRIVV